MGTSKNISRENSRWWEDNDRCSVAPDHVYFDEVPSKKDEPQELKPFLNNLFEYFDLFNDMTEEERQAFYGVFKEQKSMRKISRELGRDNHTIRRRYNAAIKKIKKHLGISPDINS